MSSITPLTAFPFHNKQRIKLSREMKLIRSGVSFPEVRHSTFNNIYGPVMSDSLELYAGVMSIIDTVEGERGVALRAIAEQVKHNVTETIEYDYGNFNSDAEVREGERRFAFRLDRVSEEAKPEAISSEASDKTKKKAPEDPDDEGMEKSQAEPKEAEQPARKKRKASEVTGDAGED